MPHSDELDQTLAIWRLAGASTWQSLLKYNVMLDSVPLAPWNENVMSLPKLEVLTALSEENRAIDYVQI